MTLIRTTSILLQLNHLRALQASSFPCVHKTSRLLTSDRRSLRNLSTASQLQEEEEAKALAEFEETFGVKVEETALQRPKMGRGPGDDPLYSQYISADIVMT
jgi:hypothetical protein